MPTQKRRAAAALPKLPTLSGPQTDLPELPKLRALPRRQSKLPTLRPAPRLSIPSRPPAKRINDERVLQLASILLIRIGAETRVEWINDEGQVPKGLGLQEHIWSGAVRLNGAYDKVHDVLYVLECWDGR